MHWLARHDKSLLMPKIVHTLDLPYSGCYYHPGDYEFEKDGHFYSGLRGIILINVSQPETIDGTLAHEWRHHWQRYSIGDTPDWDWTPVETMSEWRAQIRNYFTMWHEFDALRFEYTHARNDSNDEMWETLFGEANRETCSR